MKKLLKKLTILFLSVSLFLCLLIVAPFPAIDSMSMYQRKHKLCESVLGKKIILVGGSGVFYSMDAKLLEKQITGYHVVNMGLNAGLGLKFNLDEIKSYINPGDIIVLIPEYNNYEGYYLGSVSTLLAINSFPKALIFSPREHIKYLLYSHGLEFIPTKCQNYLNDVVLYITKTSPSMSSNGDIITRTEKRDVSKMPLSCNFEFGNATYKGCAALIENFNDYCKKRNAYAVLSFSAIPIPHYEKNKSQLASLYMNLSRDTNIPILSGPEQSIYPLDYFDDTIFHMNTEYKSIYSLDLLNRLRQLYPELIN